jgi:hypothetical protein
MTASRKPQPPPGAMIWLKADVPWYALPAREADRRYGAANDARLIGSAPR